MSERVPNFLAAASKTPTIPTIAALSVQKLKGGINTETSSSSESAFLNPEFADTPPAIATCLIPV